MHRNVSIVTRIHPPPAPPTWFKTIFYSSFLAWIVLQSATEYYTATSLYTFTHLPMFEDERQVDSAFLNMVAVGLLTVPLVLTFIYGIATVNKLIVLACAAFVFSLLILNILAVSILMSSRFSLHIGPVKGHQRILTLFHKNVSAEHWYAEMEMWSQKYPATTASADNSHDNGNFVVEDGGKFTSPQARMDPGTVTVSSLVPPAANRTHRTSRQPFALAASTPEPDTSDVNSTLWRIRQDQNKLLYLLSYFQEHAMCCGVESHRDYWQHSGRLPTTCQCVDSDSDAVLRPPCTPTVHQLVDDTQIALWSRGCRQVVDNFIGDLHYLRDLLAATIIFQFIVLMLSIIMGLNMPDKTDDLDDEGDY